MEDHLIAQWLDATIAKNETKIQDLAKHVGVSVSQISKWKSGEQSLKRPEYIFKIAEYYKVDSMRLLATAEPSFREQGFKPLPVPDGGDHLLARLPRYVGDRERSLMGRIARLGGVARREVTDNPVEQIEEAFSAIDQMLDTVQQLLKEEGLVSGESRAEGDGGAARRHKPPSTGDGEPGGAVGSKRRRRSGGPEKAHRSSLQGSLAFGW
jgi:transcriptional regulator with XRE-family HTH domain